LKQIEQEERERETEMTKKKNKTKSPSSIAYLYIEAKPSILISPFLRLNRVTNTPSLPVTPVAIVHNSLQL
jgi:hypothetical protein